MYRFVIIESKNGHEVYINLISSPAGRYLSRWPHVIDMVREVLVKTPLKGTRTVVERNMGRSIGTTDVVETTDRDSIYYAQQLKKDVFLRFAKNRYPKSSDTLTVAIVQDNSGDYEVEDVWIGPASPAFPGDEYETANSKKYWKNHALVQNARPIQTKSITRDWPY